MRMLRSEVAAGLSSVAAIKRAATPGKIITLIETNDKQGSHYAALKLNEAATIIETGSKQIAALTKDKKLRIIPMPSARNLTGISDTEFKVTYPLSGISDVYRISTKSF